MPSSHQSKRSFSSDMSYAAVVMSSKRSKREVSKADICKGLELSGHVAGLVSDVAGDINSIPVIKEMVGIVTAGVSLVGHVVKSGLDIAMTAYDCADVPFDEIKEILDKRFNEVDRKLDKNTAALEEVSKLAQKTMLGVERTRLEMNEGFSRVLQAIESSKIEYVVTRINNFVNYFVDEKERLRALPKEDFVTKLEQADYLNLLRDSRTPKGDSLRTGLFEIMEQKLAIPDDNDDTIAFKALFALYYGTQTYVSVMFYLIEKYAYLADYHYQKGDLAKYNNYFDMIKTTFQDFKHSLVGSGRGTQKPLIDSVIEVIDTVKNMNFKKSEQQRRIDSLNEMKNKLKEMVLPIVVDTPDNSIGISFKQPDIGVPIGEWRDGTEVSYAVQYENNGEYSKVSEWSNEFEVNQKACPFLKLKADPQRRTRLIFRKFGDDKPQLVGVINANEREFRDINRELYNSAGSVHTDKAGKEVKQLLDVGADINSVFEKGRRPIHAAAQQGNTNLALRFLLSDPTTIVNVKDKGGYTPIHVAADAGQAGFVKLMLRHGADVNAKTDPELLTPLHLAARNGFAKTVRNLMESDALNINEKDQAGFTPLHSAVMGGFDVVKALLSSGQIDANPKSNVGMTPLHLASINNDKAVVEVLLQSGKVDINFGDQNNMTALHFVALAGHLDVALFLIRQSGIEVNAKSADSEWTPLHYAIFFKKANVAMELLKASNIDVNSSASDGVSPLHLAVATGQMDIVNALLDKGALIEHKNREGFTPLHAAAIRKEQDIALHLISKGANISAVNKDESTPLHLAAFAGRIVIVRKLVELGAEVNLKNLDGKDPLHFAADGGNLDVIEFLINNGADINSRDEQGLLFTYVVIQRGHLNIARYLIENKKVDFNAIDDKRGDYSDEKKPIIYWAVCDAVKSGKLDMVKYFVGTLNKVLCNTLATAAREGHLDIVKYLVEEKNLDVDGTDEGITPLIGAITKDNIAIVKYLIQKKANVNKTYSGQPTLTYAIFNKNVDVVRILVDNGAKLDAKDEQGNAPLHHASRRRLNVLRYLVGEKNVDINAQNNDGDTALHLASYVGDSWTVNYLCRMGADINIKNNDKKTPYDVASSSPVAQPENCVKPKKFRRLAEFIPNGINMSNDEFINTNDKVVSVEKETPVKMYKRSYSFNDYARSMFDTLKSQLSFSSFKASDDMRRSERSVNPVIDNMDVNGALLLLDVLIRQFTGQNYIPTEVRSASESDAQAAALNITEKFEELLNALSNVPAGEQIDLSVVYSDIFKAIMSGNDSKISKILCSYVKAFSMLKPEHIEKLLDAFKSTNPTITASKREFYEHIPLLLKKTCLEIEDSGTVNVARLR